VLVRLRNSIAFRLALVIALSTALIFAVVLGYNYYQSRQLLEQELEHNARNLTLSLVNRVETELVAVEKVVKGAALALETAAHDEAELLALLSGAVAGNSEVFGAAVAFEPGAFRADRELYAPYIYRNGDSLARLQLDQTYLHLPYLYWDWYQIPRELGRLEWSEPYFDEGAGDILMSTCSVPFYDQREGKRRLRGVVTADVSLDELTNLVSSLKILDTGYAALLSRNGTVLAHPLTEAIMNETFFSIAEARNDGELRELGRRMVRGETGFIRYASLMGATSWLYHAPVKSTGWTLAVVFPEDELLANIRTMSVNMAAMGAVGLLLMILVVGNIARAMIRPLHRLAEATDQLAGGNFDAPLPPVRSLDEVGVLTRDFRAMTEALKAYIRDLTVTTAAKERIQSELNMATNIQASLLPRIFPAFPSHSEFDIYASMMPAKEVGGDFYDFFFIDESRLCFLIADVSDKGVPAALYMMVAKTLLKTEGQRLGEPSRILESVNNILAADNESCMFATVFCAILDIVSGELRFANAGHNPPLLIVDDAVSYMPVHPSLMLGAMAGVSYSTQCLQMKPGDTLFLYTDGVTEALNASAQLYGEARLLKILAGAAPGDLAAALERVRDDVARHAAGAPQSDDITMLVIKLIHLATGDGQVPNADA